MSQAQRLVEAAESNDIEALYRLLRENPSLLEHSDKIPFVDTPLHLAAASGSTHFAIEVLSLKPSFGKKLNPDGLSPMHLALLSGKPQVVRRLVECDPELIRVKGKEGCTPLHTVAGVDDSELLAVFLVENIKAIQDVNIRKETAVHVAVKSGNLDALKVLRRWLRYTDNLHILNWKDEDDNAALHIAVATKNYEMVRLLMPVVTFTPTPVKLNMLNKDGLTALDIAKEFPDSVEHARNIEKTLRLAGAIKTCTTFSWSHEVGSLAHNLALQKSFRRDVYFIILRLSLSLQNISAETRSSLFVVSGLMITATYQAVLSPPGGLTSGDNSSSSTTDGTHHGRDLPAGKVNMDDTPFYLVTICNAMPFLISMFLMIMMMPKTKYFFHFSLPLAAMSMSYGLSAGIISPTGAQWNPLIWGFVFGACIFMATLARIIMRRVEQDVK